MRFAKKLAVGAFASTLLFGVATVTATTSAFAYGHADGPVAQVEVSGNCNNATLCPELIGGTGGLWIWAELDTGGTVDYTFAGCGHTVGGGGPGQAGAGGGPGTDGTWQVAPDVFTAAGAGYLPVDVAVDKSGNLLNVPYYEISIAGGFMFAVPVPTGHYSVSGFQYILGLGHTPGLNFQTQVAP